MTTSTEQERAAFEAWIRTHEDEHGAVDEASAWAAWTARSLVQAARGAPAVPQVSDAQIREIFLAHGFTVKDGLTDLKPYVYAAARALLAAAPQPPEAEKHVAQRGAENEQKTGETQYTCGFDGGGELTEGELASGAAAYCILAVPSAHIEDAKKLWPAELGELEEAAAPLQALHKAQELIELEIQRQQGSSK